MADNSGVFLVVCTLMRLENTEIRVRVRATRTSKCDVMLFGLFED